MLTKLFIGLTFFEDNHFAKKIQNFRSRYDEKSLTNASVFMPLISPFEVPVTAVKSLATDVSDELEAFFPEDDGVLTMGFTGLDVYSHNRKMLLYLNPQELTDLEHCAEALAGICKEHVEDRQHMPKSDKSFLTIGRFTDPTALHGALSVGQREFQDCTSLPIKGVCLFRKHNGIWYQEADLHRFRENNEAALLSQRKV